MKNEKIKELHKKHIEILEAKIKNLEKQNSILNNKNIFLEAKLDENNKIIAEDFEPILTDGDKAASEIYFTNDNISFKLAYA